MNSNIIPLFFSHTGLHKPGRDKVAAVIGMDISYRFLNLMLSNWLPECDYISKLEHSQSSSKVSEPGSDKSSINSTETAAVDNETVSEDSLADRQPQWGIENSQHPRISKSHSLADTRCFLMDDRGYIMAHPSFYEPGRDRLVEHNHLSYLLV